MDCEASYCIPLSCGASDDTWVSHFDAKGVYSVRSGYRLAMELKEAQGGSAVTAAHDWWIKLWRFNIRNNIENFVWRAFNDILSCLASLAHRGVSCIPTCRCCGEESETI